MKNVAILGFGTVGSGVYEMLSDNREAIRRACGEALSVKYILDIRDFSDRSDAQLFTKDFSVILDDPSVDIVAEVIGGVHPAFDFTLAALKAGKHVVTSNKELVASHGSELLAAAEAHNVNYLFEASVGGGIPVIRTLHDSLSVNEIGEISGILNGTTNYILTEMFAKGQSFDKALADAQALGYAERDPSSDVDGIDACRKIAILLALITGKSIPCDRIVTEGITGLSSRDVLYAASAGGVIKLIGYAYTRQGSLYAAVSPTIVPAGHPFVSVSGVNNMIAIRGDAVGEVMLYGRGAGSLPTASAVVADLCDIAKDGNNKRYGWTQAEEETILPYDEAEEQYLVRVDDSGRARAAEVFGDISFIESPDGAPEAAFIAPRMKNGEFHRAAADLPILGKLRLYKGSDV